MQVRRAKRAAPILLGLQLRLLLRLLLKLALGLLLRKLLRPLAQIAPKPTIFCMRGFSDIGNRTEMVPGHGKP